MKRIYHRYEIWEDYLNGMYNTNIIDFQQEIDLIDKSVELLSNQGEFFDVATNMINSWKFSADQNLSNNNCNRRAWVGQASCSYNHSCPEILTRKAWSIMPLFHRYEANKTADRIIRIYERKNRRIYQELGNKLLF